MNDGPENYEEVFQEEVKPHPSVLEDKAKYRLEMSWASRHLGLKAILHSF